MRMQEHRSKEAKKAAVTLLTSHMPTPSTLPRQPWLDEEVRTLRSTTDEVVVALDRKLNKLEQLEEEEVVAAMYVRIT